MKEKYADLENEEKLTVFSIVISGISLMMSFLNVGHFPVDIAWIAVGLCGIPILKEAITELVTKFDIKADLLVSLALVASVWIGEIFAAGEIVVIMTIGSLLEERTVAKARARIESLVDMTPQQARVVHQKGEETIPVEQVRLGDTVRVLAGENIPVDGIIVTGQTYIDQSMITGESLPVEKSVKDEVFAGTINQFGIFDMTVTKVSEDSSLQRMIQLVSSSDAGKVKIVRIADRWATWIVMIALSSAALTWFLTGEIVRAVTILVVFCPCALVLATPTAIMAGIGNATKYGILVREGDALERLAKVPRFAFDKTGTLTHGKPTVIKTESFDPSISSEELLVWTASAELRSEHPLGKAVVKHIKSVSSKSLPEPSAFQLIAGRGVSAHVNGKNILAGNEQLLNENSIAIPDEMKKDIEKYKSKGCTVIYIAIDNYARGIIVLSDTLREDSPKAIQQIHELGVKSSLLTGDNQYAACYIANIAGITDVHANCMPEDKMEAIKQYQEKEELVCMIGDGVNDSLAIKTAHVGIAMGGVGSDIAIQSSDIVFVGEDLRNLPHLLRLSRKVMTTIKLNIIFSMVLNFTALFLAMTGVLNPVAGALVHNAGSVLVIVNSAFLLNWN
ncbi:MAG: heavy metal translocating P-type ATPase [Methanomethylovorans sp.]|uniref:heavy metal translocating P-type ATPase n=1 Tax=Methanomethylovorans sp. TaxID=2758717 RepID=UPI003530C3C7